jgi:hypothetical protein
MTTGFKVLCFISVLLSMIIVSACVVLPSAVSHDDFYFKKQRGLNLQGKSFIVNVVNAPVSEDDKYFLTEMLIKKLRTISDSIFSVLALKFKDNSVIDIPYDADTTSLNLIARISSGDYLVNSTVGAADSDGLGSTFTVQLCVFDLHTHKKIYEQAVRLVEEEPESEERFTFVIYQSDKKLIKQGLATVARDLCRASKSK